MLAVELAEQLGMRVRARLELLALRRVVAVQPDLERLLVPAQQPVLRVRAHLVLLALRRAGAVVPVVAVEVAPLQTRSFSAAMAGSSPSPGPPM